MNVDLFSHRDQKAFLKTLIEEHFSKITDGVSSEIHEWIVDHFYDDLSECIEACEREIQNVWTPAGDIPHDACELLTVPCHKGGKL